MWYYQAVGMDHQNNPTDFTLGNKKAYTLATASEQFSEATVLMTDVNK